MWFTDPNNNRLGKIDTSGNITELAAVPATNVGFPLFGSQITTGPDGKLYFTEVTLNADSTVKASAIGIYDPAANTYSEVPLAAGQEPFGITAGTGRQHLVHRGTADCRRTPS